MLSHREGVKGRICNFIVRDDRNFFLFPRGGKKGERKEKKKGCNFRSSFDSPDNRIIGNFVESSGSGDIESRCQG